MVARAYESHVVFCLKINSEVSRNRITVKSYKITHIK